MNKQTEATDAIRTGDLDRRHVLSMLLASAAALPARAALGQTPTPTPLTCAGCAPTPAEGTILSRNLLFPLVADLVREEKLRKRFAADPDALFNEYGLGTDLDAQAVLYTMNKKCMHDYLSQETTKWLTKFLATFTVSDAIKLEDPLEGEDPDPCDTDITTSYPDTRPRIARVRAKRKNNNKVVVRVFGQSLPRKAEVWLKKGMAETKNTSGSVGGTYRSSFIVAHFDTLAAGKYDVQIRFGSANCPIVITEWAVGCQVDVP